MKLFTGRNAELEAIRNNFKTCGLIEYVRIENDTEVNNEDFTVYLDIDYETIDALINDADTNDNAKELLNKLMYYFQLHNMEIDAFYEILCSKGYKIPLCRKNNIRLGITEEELNALCDTTSMRLLLTNFEKKRLIEIKEQLRISELTDVTVIEDVAYDTKGNLLATHSAVYIIGVPYLKQYEVHNLAKAGDIDAKALDEKIAAFHNAGILLNNELYNSLIAAGFCIPRCNKLKLYIGMSREEILALCK